MKNNSLLKPKTYISIIISIVFIVSVIIFIIWNSNKFNDKIISSEQTSLLVKAEIITTGIEKGLLGYIRLSQLLANSQFIINAFLHNHDHEFYAEDCPVKNIYLTHKEELDAIMLISDDGTLLHRHPVLTDSIPDYHLREDIDFVIQNHRAYISGVYININGKPAIAVSYPVFNKGRFIGIIRFTILTGTIIDQFITPVLDENTFVITADNQGNIFYKPYSIFKGETVYDLLNKDMVKYPEHDFSKRQEILIKKVRGETGSAVYHLTDNKGRFAKMIMVYRSVNIIDRKYNISLYTNYNIITQPLKQYVLKLILLIAFIVLIFVVIGLFMLRLLKLQTKMLDSKKLAEEAEQKLKLHIDQTPLAVIEWSLDFKVNSWNKAAQKISGYSKEEVIGKYGNFLIPANERKYTNDIRRKLITSKRGAYNIIDVITKHGERINCEWHNTPLINSNGETIGIASLVQDITKYKQAEKEIKLSEMKFRLLFEKANDAILLLNKNIFIDCNKKALEMFACSKEDIIGQTPYKLSPELQADGRCSKEKALEKIKASLKGDIPSFEWIHTKLNGTPFFTEISLNSFILKGERVIQTIIRDISVRKNIEDKLLKAIIEAEESERKRFAENLHDELGPYLSGIKLYVTQLTKEKLNLNQRLRFANNLDEMIDESISITKLISNSLMPNILTDFGYIKALESFIGKINNTQNIHIDFIKPKVIKKVNSSDEIIIYRILIELINNTLKHANADKIKIRILQNNNMKIEYSDDGIGFSLQNIMNEKTGNGLINISNRLKSINAQYTFNSYPDKGIHFEFEISPLTD